MKAIPEDSYQKYTRDVLIIGASNVLIALSGLALLPLLTKYLGAQDYGLWAQIMVTIGLVQNLITLGLPAAMSRFLPAKTDKGEIQEEFYSVLCLTFLSALLFSLAIILSAELIAEAFFGGATEVVRVTGLIILVMSPAAICSVLFRAFRQIKKIAIYGVAVAYGQVALIAVLILNGYGLFSIVIGVLGINVIGFFVLLFLVNRYIGIKMPHFSRIKEYLSFGLPSIPGGIAYWFVASSDRYVIAYFLGTTSVGIYSAGYTLGSVLLMVPIAIGSILTPTVSKLFDNSQMDEVRVYLSYSLKYFLVLAIPFVFGAVMLSESVLMVFSTPEIASEGYFITPLVALSILFVGVNMVMTQNLFLVKKTRTLAVIWIVAAAVNLTLNILVIPLIGILGAAITTLTAYSIVLGVTTYYSVKELRFSFQWGFIRKSLVAASLMSLLIWMADPDRILSIIATVVTSIVIYMVLLLLLKGFSGEDIKFFKGLYQRFS